MKLLPLVQINRLGMNGRERAREIHFADHFGPAGGVHDHEIVGGHRAQADGVGGIGLLRPVPVLPGAMQIARFGEPFAEIGDDPRRRMCSLGAIGSSNAAHFR